MDKKEFEKNKRKKIIGECLPGPNKIKVGDVLAIPLGENFWGYVRAYRDASFEILSVRSKNELLSLDELKKCSGLSFCGYCEPWDKPTWIFLGNWPFEDMTKCWPPPTYIVDILNPKIIKIYHKGKMTRCNDRDELKDIEKNKGLLFPGKLVEKIRSELGMSIDRSKIEEIAPYTSNDRRFAL